MPLEKLSSVFGLAESKGHLFNIPENFNYDGVTPALHYYQPDYMSPNKRAKLLEWYERVRE